MRQWYADNPEKYEAHKARVRERARRLRAEDPGAVRIEEARRMREWRAKGGAAARAAKLLAQRSRRARAFEYVTSLKEGKPCADCGQVFPPVCMDFDHVRGVKYLSVGQMAACGYGVGRLDDEIAKCELVCANCHRIRTHDRRGQDLTMQEAM